MSRVMWLAGWPIRFILLALVRAYRVTLGQLVGGNCRFHPSCSEYSEAAIRSVGAVRGIALTAWRIARCSPLSKGGVDLPPGARRSPMYDADIHAEVSP